MDGTTFSAEASFLLAARQAPNFWHHNTPAVAGALQSSAPLMLNSPLIAAFPLFSTRCTRDHPQYRAADPVTALSYCHRCCLLCATTLAPDHHSSLLQVLQSRALFFYCLASPELLSLRFCRAHTNFTRCLQVYSGCLVAGGALCTPLDSSRALGCIFNVQLKSGL